MRTSPCSSRIRIWLGCVLLLAFAAGARGVVDPFYEKLYREGLQAIDHGNAERAAKLLRLAGFGMLDEPVRLAGCLVRLALAEADLGERDAFIQTFNRVLEVEERFGAYSKAELPPDARRAFEVRLEDWISYENLRAVAAFRPLARRKLRQQVESMPVAERRQELAAWIEAEPDELEWKLMSARLELLDGDPSKALEWATAVLAVRPSHGEARCLRGRARLHLELCQPALDDLEACGDFTSDPELAEGLLGCYIELEAWDAADALLAELPEDLRRRGNIRRYARQVRRGVGSRPRSEETSSQDAGSEETDASAELEGPESGAPVDAIEPPAVQLSAEMEAVIERTHEILRSGSRDDLSGAFARIMQLAQDYPAVPELQQLAAEVAYRLARWQLAVAYFERGGEIDSRRPELQFYYAVALYETGEREAAARILERSLPRIERTPFVASYAEKILGPRR